VFSLLLAQVSSQVCDQAGALPVDQELQPQAGSKPVVEPDGEVVFCGDFPDYSLGNVRRESFREIWTGERANRFRAKLAREPLPICARCCGNYVYGKWERPAASPAPALPANP